MFWIRRRAVLAAIVVVGAAATSPAGAYEFELRTRTIGQAEELRSLRFVGGSLFLSVRRFTQTLSLSIWDIGQPSRMWRLYDTRPRPRGPRYSFHGYLRLDHDFGEWTGGHVNLGSRSPSAVDLVPELENRSLQLDVLYAYAAVEDVVRTVDLYVGRQLGADALDWYAFDGALARVRARHVSTEVFGGFQVRESSPVGWPELEPDGTSGAECQEYVEGATPGTGEWRAIDLGRREDTDPFRSDLEVCPQRDEPMPTFGGALELTGVKRLSARLSYRRAMSATPDVIGARDRLDFPDTGLYPDEVGQVPEWGINQERVALSVRSPWELRRGKGEVAAFGAVRYSLLHSLVDEALVGARARWGADAVEPELTWSFPTFDGDSIFNAFSAQPHAGARLTWEHAPRGEPWRTYVRSWVRRYRTEDADRAAPGADVDTGALSGGLQTGAGWRAARDRMVRLDLVHEGGYGGRRSGGWAQASWRVTRDLQLGSRLSLIDFESDLSGDVDGFTLGLQGGATYKIHDDIAVSLVAEDSSSPSYRNQVALFAALDMAFRPEM